MGPVAEPEGDLFAQTFERKEKCIWVPFLDTEAINILSLRPSGTLVKEQASPEFILDNGAKRATSITPSYIRTVRARTHF